MALTVTLIRPVLAITAVLLLRDRDIGLALAGVWFASLGDMVTRMILVLKRYKKGKWQDIKV